MSPELSRRVAKIMFTERILNMLPSERIAFTNAVSGAEKFSQLGKEVQQIVNEAEAEAQVSNKPKKSVK